MKSNGSANSQRRRRKRRQITPTDFEGDGSFEDHYLDSGETDEGWGAQVEAGEVVEGSFDDVELQEGWVKSMEQEGVEGVRDQTDVRT